MKLAEGDIRAEYAHSLVNIGRYRSSAFGALAFGESNIKARVKSIVSFKRRAIWMSVIAVVILIAVGTVCLTGAAGWDGDSLPSHEQLMNEMNISKDEMSTESEPKETISPQKTIDQPFPLITTPEQIVIDELVTAGYEVINVHVSEEHIELDPQNSNEALFNVMVVYTQYIDSNGNIQIMNYTFRHSVNENDDKWRHTVPVPWTISKGSFDTPEPATKERILEELIGSIGYHASSGDEYLDITVSSSQNPFPTYVTVIGTLNKHPEFVPDTFAIPDEVGRDIRQPDGTTYTTHSYRMSGRGIEDATLSITFSDGEVLTYSDLYVNWLKVREYEKFFAEELDTSVTAADEDAAKDAARTYYDGSVLGKKITNLSRIQDLSDYRFAVIPDRVKGTVIAFWATTIDTPGIPRNIVLTKNEKGTWEVINEGY
jgi:hypothetical protein